MSQGSAVGELGRSAASGSPVCKHSVEAGRESSSTADARRFFRVFPVIRGYIPGTVTGRSQPCFCRERGPEILE